MTQEAVLEKKLKPSKEKGTPKKQEKPILIRAETPPSSEEIDKLIDELNASVEKIVTEPTLENEIKEGINERALEVKEELIKETKEIFAATEREFDKEMTNFLVESLKSSKEKIKKGIDKAISFLSQTKGYSHLLKSHAFQKRLFLTTLFVLSLSGASRVSAEEIGKEEIGKVASTVIEDVYPEGADSLSGRVASLEKGEVSKEELGIEKKAPKEDLKSLFKYPEDENVFSIKSYLEQLKKLPPDDWAYDMYLGNLQNSIKLYNKEHGDDPLDIHQILNVGLGEKAVEISQERALSSLKEILAGTKDNFIKGFRRGPLKGGYAQPARGIDYNIYKLFQKMERAVEKENWDTFFTLWDSRADYYPSAEVSGRDDITPYNEGLASLAEAIDSLRDTLPKKVTAELPESPGK